MTTAGWCEGGCCVQEAVILHCLSRWVVQKGAGYGEPRASFREQRQSKASGQTHTFLLGQGPSTFWTYHLLLALAQCSCPMLASGGSKRCKALWNTELKKLLFPMCQERNSRSLSCLSVSMEINKVPNAAQRPCIPPRTSRALLRSTVVQLCGGGV